MRSGAERYSEKSGEAFGRKPLAMREEVYFRALESKLCAVLGL